MMSEPSTHAPKPPAEISSVLNARSEPAKLTAPCWKDSRPPPEPFGSYSTWASGLVFWNSAVHAWMATCCEEAPVEPKQGRNRETGERYTFTPDLCDECFGNAARTFGDWRKVKEISYTGRFVRPCDG